jgi:prevent-host-death family protein
LEKTKKNGGWPEASGTRDKAVVTVTIDEAQSKLKDLIDNLKPGEEVVITENDQPVARLVPTPAQKSRPIPGSCKGMLTIASEDDAHLEDFEEYMA